MPRPIPAVLALLVLVVTGCSSGSSGPGSVAQSSSTASTSGGDYLALGDSVAFGTRPDGDESKASDFVGFPALVAKQLGLRLTNAACPGEATGGFLSSTGTDNVCRPYRSKFPLHTSYTGTQMGYAVSFLRAHPQTKLVTLTLGANDLFVCVRDTPGHCTGAGELTASLAAVKRNLQAILTKLRAVYDGPLVATTYYATNYQDALSTAGISAVDAVIADTVRAAHGTVADAFSAFQAKAKSDNGDACKAGLLAPKSNGCDIHPSPAGAQVLADAVVAADRSG